MEITGRIVADATVRATKSDKKLTGFRVAINHRYKANGEQKEETTYVECAYWRTDAIAPYLTKGMVVQLSGQMTAQSWVNRDGEAMAALHFHTNEITMLTKSTFQGTVGVGKTASQAGNKNGVIKPSKQFN